MRIRSPPHLRYPITIVELLCKQGEEIKRSAPLFKYSYETVVSEADKYGELKEVKKRFPERFNSPNDGTVSEWFVKPGTLIERPGVNIAEIDEPCSHEVQFGGLCANCGKDMTTVDYLTVQRNSERATINMTHNNVALLVSEKEAGRADEEAKARLLQARKLSLIVDLDQTVIHTTCERTVAEWQADPENPNYEAVKDVQSFQLADDNVAHVAANWYYVKMRPGLKEFLERMSSLYEMHIYTMATRAYAQAVAKIIDPDGRYFGDRILSRDENYTDKLKSLHRLFPTNTDMVVIIDDRADIWHYSDNLIRVPVFNFFPGAGDINASFLPKQQELITTTAKGARIEAAPKEEEGAGQESAAPAPTFSVAGKPAEPGPTEATNGELTELEQQLLSMGSEGHPEVLEEQVKEQEKVIQSQQTERPLLQKQLELDKEDEEAGERDRTEEGANAENGITEETPHSKHRHSLLNNDDTGIEVIERNLKAVHQKFYDEYRAKKRVPAGGRVAELKGSPKKRITEFVPDIKDLMPRMKREVLDGCTIVFSGIIPLGMDVQTSDLALWVKSFGAEVALNVNRRTTHLIANPERRTSKVKKAARYQHIKIVNVDWMFQCCTRWEHVDEAPYLIELEPGERGDSPLDDLEDTDVGASGDEGADEDLPLSMSPDQWKSVDDEFEAFMNETDDSEDENNSDSDSVRSDNSTRTTDSKQSTRKRKRVMVTADESGAEESDASAGGTSRLQRRKRRTMERVSSLTNVVSADRSSGLPSPETTGPEEEQGEEENAVKPTGLDVADDDYDDGLEAEMLAQFEATDDEA
ncbi:uncharacterized protein EI97DRAFT_435560 [Westerdykella ornata]|uniref:RNA polymerase II subunit A C-terminal domain phosphatase n=1 Tax=Westerdykella ornata TaxID=318751 RepID=A0A6A6JCG7_WESOR|nr:uncharacterized protein EI97DRAFT_435560 [Westerdykella ornata]KAF2273914.1 hypothetical protein EI97DRAFT_435560 [Westerdykella ornata]